MSNFWTNKKVLITGCSGFSGSWMIIYLKLLGAKVCGYSLKKKDKRFIFNDLKMYNNIQFCDGDILNKVKLKKFILLSKPDIIFHLAAEPIVIDCFENPKKAFDVNTLGTLNLLQIIKELKVKKKIQLNIVTTDKVYKNTNKMMKFNENSELGGDDPYSASKTCAEILINSYYQSYFKNKLSVNSLRAGNIIGGGDWSKYRLVPDIFNSIFNKKKLIIRNPNHIRPWQHVFDVIHAYLKISQNTFGKNKFEKWNIGPSQKKAYTVLNILNIINKLLKLKNYFLFKKSNNFEKRYLALNTKKIKNLKIKNKLTIQKSLILTTEWYRNFFINNDKSFSEKQVKEYLRLK